MPKHGQYDARKSRDPGIKGTYRASVWKKAGYFHGLHMVVEDTLVRRDR